MNFEPSSIFLLAANDIANRFIFKVRKLNYTMPSLSQEGASGTGRRAEEGTETEDTPREHRLQQQQRRPPPMQSRTPRPIMPHQHSAPSSAAAAKAALCCRRLNKLNLSLSLSEPFSPPLLLAAASSASASPSAASTTQRTRPMAAVAKKKTSTTTGVYATAARNGGKLSDYGYVCL